MAGLASAKSRETSSSMDRIRVIRVFLISVFNSFHFDVAVFSVVMLQIVTRMYLFVIIWQNRKECKPFSEKSGTKAVELRLFSKKTALNRPDTKELRFRPEKGLTFLFGHSILFRSHRGVAKLGIALGSGPRGLGFKSRHSDLKRVP